MEKNKKKKNYYQNNKKYYHKNNHQQESKPKNTYDKIVNVRNDVSEIKESNIIEEDNYLVMKLVFVTIVVIAIIFSSLLVFHLL